MRAGNSRIMVLLFLSMLLAACGGGGGGSDSPGSDTNATNQAPTITVNEVADAFESDTVTLTGSAADADGTIASVAWVQLAGSTVTLDTASETSASFTAPTVPANETLSFRITVTDDDGATAVADVDVLVKPLRRIDFAPSRDFSMAVTQPLRVLAFVYERDELIVPTYAAPLVLNWQSGVPAVATVTAQGHVKALSPGDTDITASWVDPDGITRSATVTVTVDGALPFWAYFEHDNVNMHTAPPDIGGYPSDILVARHGKTTGGVYESEVDCPQGWELVYDNTLVSANMPDTGLPRQLNLDFAMEVADEAIDGGWTVLEAYCGAHAMSPLYIGTSQRRALYYTWTYLDATYDSTSHTRMVLDGDRVFAASIGYVPVSPWPSVEPESIFIEFPGNGEAIVEKIPIDYAVEIGLVADPLNPGRPLMCSQTVGVDNVRCWHKDEAGDWQIEILNAGFYGRVSTIAMTGDGTAYYLVTDAYGSNNPALATSTSATRDDWNVAALNLSPPVGYAAVGNILALAAGPDDEPRLLLTFVIDGSSDTDIFYASRSPGGAWSFEKIAAFPSTAVGSDLELHVGADNRVRAVFPVEYEQTLAVRENGNWTLDAVYTYNSSDTPNPNQPAGMTYGFGMRPDYFNGGHWITYSELPLDGDAGHWYDEQVAINSFTGMVGVVKGVARDESNRVHLLTDSWRYDLTYLVLSAPPSYFEPTVVAEPESNTQVSP